MVNNLALVGVTTTQLRALISFLVMQPNWRPRAKGSNSYARDLGAAINPHCSGSWSRVSTSRQHSQPRVQDVRQPGSFNSLVPQGTRKIKRRGALRFRLNLNEFCVKSVALAC